MEKETWWFVSNQNMMLNQDVFQRNRDNLDDYGVNDCIEQTYHAYVAYKEERFLTGIKNCWLGKKPQRYPIRFPEMKGMSRDHIIYSFMAFIHSGMSKEEINSYVNSVPFFIGDNLGTTMTLKLWLWMKLISGKKIGVLYYPLVYLSALYNVNYNLFIDKKYKTGFIDEDQDTFVTGNHMREIAKKYYPTYALKLSANMLSVVSDNWFTKNAKKLLLKITPSKNYVIKILLGEKVDKNVVHKPMTCYCWSEMLNPIICNRPIMLIEKNFPQYSVEKYSVDKDYLTTLLSCQ